MRVSERLQPGVPILAGGQHCWYVNRSLRGVDIDRHRAGVDDLENQPHGERKEGTADADEGGVDKNRCGGNKKS